MSVKGRQRLVRGALAGVGVIAIAAWLGGRAPLHAAQPPSEGQTEFVPISELPPEDRLPAAPLLIGAYAFVWVVLVAYLWSIAKRLGKVDAELSRLERLIARPPTEHR